MRLTKNVYMQILENFIFIFIKLQLKPMSLFIHHHHHWHRCTIQEKPKKSINHATALETEIKFDWNSSRRTLVCWLKTIMHMWSSFFECVRLNSVLYRFYGPTMKMRKPLNICCQRQLLVTLTILYSFLVFSWEKKTEFFVISGFRLSFFC